MTNGTRAPGPDAPDRDPGAAPARGAGAPGGPGGGGPAAEDPTAYTPPGEAPRVGEERPENRPLGVSVLAILYALGAVGLVLAGLGALVGGLGAAFEASAALAGYAVLGGLLALVLAGLLVGIAYGLWTRYRWAWSIAFYLSVLGALVNLVGLFAADFMSSLIGLVVNGVILWYLMQPHVKTWFGAGGMGPSARGRPA